MGYKLVHKSGVGLVPKRVPKSEANYLTRKDALQRAYILGHSALAHAKDNPIMRDIVPQLEKNVTQITVQLDKIGAVFHR